ncbi:TonB-dependent receptor [Blastomonas sp.]|uniref:TonB-dependent receptor n=1 Tax=Blastomonas sp. TaxID=1909299 RepID=UPI00260A3BAA|nr:TonB-dependent receptor [Blastomonas sp.]MDM7955795.1 TonB-dependent receptor [Blastomonas sp.]
MGKTQKQHRVLWLAARTSLAALVVLSATLPPNAAAQAAGRTQQFDIAAGPLDQALRQYMALTGRQLLYPSSLVAHRNAPAIKGPMDADQALRRLLSGQQILVRKRARNVIVLTAAPAERPRSLGQSRNPSPPRTPRLQPQRPQPPAEARDDVPIVVTGSNIRSTGIGVSPLIEITSENIERSGTGTIAEALALLPQNFGGTANEDTSLTGSDRTINNLGLGSSINLRGLGSDATLTLVNGRRVAGSGGRGDFTDLSLIPLAAVERIEILTDGASAVYGSDAVGGVVNLLLRRDFEGTETRYRLGSVTRGGSQDVQLGQLAGTRWAEGHILVAYEFQRREALSSSSRAYTRSADLRPLGGNDYRLFFSAPGTVVALDPALRTFVPAFAVPAGQDGTALRPQDFVPGQNLASPRAQVDLLPRQTRHSLYITGEQQLGSAATLYAEGRYTNRQFQHLAQPSLTVMSVTRANPFFVSPNGSPVTNIAYLFDKDLGPLRTQGKVEAWSGTGGARAEFGGDWQVDGFVSYARQSDHRRNNNILNATALNEALGTTPDDPLTPFSAPRDGFFNPFGEGRSNNSAVLNFIGSGFIDERFSSGLLNGSLVADGTIFEAPAGSVKLAIGMQARRENFSRRTLSFLSGRTPSAGIPIDADRTIVSAFAEVAAPLVGAANAVAGIERLDLSAAVRAERYSDFGTTVNPKIGLAWQPSGGVMVRASAGTSFRAPALFEVRDAPRISNTQLPAIGGGNRQVISLGGGNTNLDPETARSLTVGATITPPTMPGLSFEATFFQTRFRNRIGQPANENILQALTNPIFAPFVTFLDPQNNSQDRARIADLIASPNSTIQPTVNPDLFSAIVDGRFVNSARVDIRGFDLSMRYGFALGDHTIAFAANATVMIDFKDQITPASPLIERVGTLGNPVDFRARSTIDWSWHEFGANFAINHVGGYSDNISVPARPISSWTSLDFQLRFLPDLTSGFARGFSAALTVQNVFDRDPPFVDRSLGFGYDPANADVLGRFVALQLKKRW